MHERRFHVKRLFLTGHYAISCRKHCNERRPNLLRKLLNRFRPGLCSGPSWAAHGAPPDPLVGWGGGYPLPIPHPLDAFGVSILHLRRLELAPPPLFRPKLRHCKQRQLGAIKCGKLVCLHNQFELEFNSRPTITIASIQNVLLFHSHRSASYWTVNRTKIRTIRRLEVHRH